ncbi:MAG: hypothetical protein O2833_04120 [Proteobacteria bacterium]|nr:hypothetical protein [Pseudomonadota bacterium]
MPIRLKFKSNNAPPLDPTVNAADILIMFPPSKGYRAFTLPYEGRGTGLSFGNVSENTASS